MRQIVYSKIIKKRFSIYEDKVIEEKNGEYYSKQIATQILIYKREGKNESIKKLEELDRMQQKKAAKKICIDKYFELENEVNNLHLWEEEPMKRYEIYKLIADDEKILMIDTKYFPKIEASEVYYDKTIATEIYESMINLEENVLCSFPDLMEVYQGEVEQIQDKIEKLKKEDDLKYNEDLKNYRIIFDSYILKSLKEELENTKKENVNLMEKIEKANDIIKSLSKKLEFALEKVEDLQNSKLTFWDKIRSIFKKQKKLPSRRI